MTAARTPSIRQIRARANRLLERILADLAEEGLLEPAVAADGREGYRITDAGLDYLARHGIAAQEETTRRTPFRAKLQASPSSRSTTRSGGRSSPRRFSLTS
jgi:DNA-binding PadR family transcriptional regulator